MSLTPIGCLVLCAAVLWLGNRQLGLVADAAAVPDGPTCNTTVGQCLRVEGGCPMVNQVWTSLSISCIYVCFSRVCLSSCVGEYHCILLQVYTLP